MTFYGWDAQGNRCKAEPEMVFPFLRESGHILSLVGAGGKTTLMMALAQYCAALGQRVLVSTTTHIFQPTDGSYVCTEEQLQARWAQGQPAVVGKEVPGGKLSMLPEEELQAYMAKADTVFLESDGSKRLPLKVPAEGEPVLIPQSDIVLAVCGLSSLGHPLQEKCFRLEQAQALLGKAPTETITENDFVHIFTSDRGGRKQVGNRIYYMVLNQCDGAEQLQSADQIAHDILYKTGEKMVAAHLKTQAE